MSSLYELAVQQGALEAQLNWTTAQTDIQLVAAPGANKQIYVVGIVIHTKVAGQIALRDASALVSSHRYDLAANGGVVLGCTEVNTPWGVNKAVTVTTDITGNHMARVYYIVR